ncbi:MAG: PilN domain-containing protein [Deltaproteobacteria bacterium]|nr:PilN domain-containing protein [Deltaproteobacteria bacterium]
MIRINLLPVRAERKKQTLRKQLITGVLVILLAVATCAYLEIMITGRIKKLNREIKRTRQQIAALKPVVDKINRYKKQQEEIKKKIEVINNLAATRLDPVYVLHDINRYKPDKLWLTKLDRKAGSLSIKGIAIDNETIVNFLNNLKNSAFLHHSELAFLKSTRINDLELKEFLINTTITSQASRETGGQDQDGKQAKGK